MKPLTCRLQLGGVILIWWQCFKMRGCFCYTFTSRFVNSHVWVWTAFVLSAFLEHQSDLRISRPKLQMNSSYENHLLVWRSLTVITIMLMSLRENTTRCFNNQRRKYNSKWTRKTRRTRKCRETLQHMDTDIRNKQAEVEQAVVD